MASIFETLLERIDDSSEDLANLCLTLGNTYGPTGRELPTAKAVHEWYRQHGIESRVDEIMEERGNAVAVLRGKGSGPSIMFNAHLDTEADAGPEYDYLLGVPNANEVGAWREGDRIFGHTVLNDRGCMAAFMIAARAIHESGIDLNGDVVLVSAAGETGAVPVDEYKGLRYQGKGFGTSYLIDHGPRTTFAVIAESTSNSITTFNCGVFYFKISVRGRLMYTPRLVRSETLADHPNAIVKAARLITALEAWAIEFESRRTMTHSGSEVRPKAQVTGVRGNLPWRPSRSAPYCSITMDVRTLPGERPEDIEEEILKIARDVGIAIEVETLLIREGAETTEAGPVVGAIERAHQTIRGVATPPPPSQDLSMYRDTIPLIRAGIPAVSFGPHRGDAAVQGTGHFELGDLVDAAKIYALTALQVTGTSDADL